MFEKLRFDGHKVDDSGTQATIFFDNGYGASVITGDMFYTSEDKPYELAVMKGDAENHSICYDTIITTDVCGYLDQADVIDLLSQVSKLDSEGK